MALRKELKMSQLELHVSENNEAKPYANGGILRANVTKRYGKKEEVTVFRTAMKIAVRKAPKPAHMLSTPSHVS
jgi:hypothetical protein